MTPEQCLALIEANNRVREAARYVVEKWNANKETSVAIAMLYQALVEFDLTEKETRDE